MIIRTATCVLLLFAISCAEVKDTASGQIAESVTMTNEDFNDIGSLLHISRKSAKVILHSNRRKAELVLDFYRDGNRLPERSVIGGGTKVGDGIAQSKDIDCGFEALDMDYITLADGKPNHCRVMLQLRFNMGTSRASSTGGADVAKSTFDFSRWNASTQFDASASTANEVPLFCWFRSNTYSLATGKTVDALIRANPKGDLAIVSLRLGD